MSAENWAFFSDVQMYRSTSDPTSNMEHLWNLQDPITLKDPGEDSLFNLTSLKKLVKLGLKTPNIISNKTATYQTDFQLDNGWTDLATTLGLDETGDATMGPKRAYMIWLWMTTLWNQTFARIEPNQQPEGSYQIGIIGTLGATAFSTEMTVMQLEVPMLTIATATQNAYKKVNDCAAFYASENLVNAT